MCLTRDQVIAEIDAAFYAVTLGDGVGLQEGQGLDDHWPRDALVGIREKDEKLDWRRIPGAELSRCYSSLSFFDAEGMRFHLPAFMIADLRGELNFDVVFTLTHGFTDCMTEMVFEVAEIYRAPGEPNKTWFGHGAAAFSLLSDAQAQSVVRYLTFKAEDEWDRDAIQHALRNYWSRRTGTP